MRAKERIQPISAKTLIWALLIAFMPVGLASAPSANAATTVSISDTDPALVFDKSKATNIVGSGGTAENDVVLYKTVGTYGGVAVDAVITTLSVSGSISNYDNPGSASTAAGAANNWMINTVGGEARFRFEFFRAGTYTRANTGIPVVLQNVKITSIDLDCSSAAGSYQYTDATGFQKYSMMSPTNLAVQTVASTNRVRFIANKSGSRSSVPEDQVMLKYDAVQTIEFSFGNIVAGSTNYFGLVFGGWPNGGTPIEYTNQYNAPPVSSDTSTYVVDTSTASAFTTIPTSAFGNYSDPDNNPFMQVKITAVSAGTLVLNGTNVSPTQVISIADIESGLLKYNPAGSAASNTITFFVQDGLDYSVASYTLTLIKVANSQTITFANPGTKGTGAGTFASGATTSSGLTVVLTSLTPGICTVSGESITAVEAGTCVIVASQPGRNPDFGAAAPVTQEFQIVSGTAPTTPQVITFNRPDSMTVGSAAYTTNATSDSGLPVTLTSITPTLCTVSGLSVSPVAVGDCKIEATQPGISTVLPALKVTLTIPVYAIAGGGTAPNVRTTGPKFTAKDAATLTGRIDDNGLDTNFYFCYKKTDIATVSNGVLGGSPTCTSAYLLTSASANFEVTADLSGLQSGTYYYQIVGWHTGNGKVYGGIWKFRPQNRPYIRTTDATSITQTTAALNGSVYTSSSSQYNITVCYSREFKVSTDYNGKLTSCDKTLSATPRTVKQSSFRDVLLNASGLTGSTHYYYQVIAEKSGARTYGNIVQFDTLSPPATVVTGSATGFTSSGVTVNGSISPNGNSVVPKFCITETFTAVTLTTANCLSGGLVTATPSTASGSSSLSIQYSATGLTVGKVYYYQAYSDPTSIKGAIKSFTFGAPVATTQAATNVKISTGAIWQAVLNGYINPNGFTSENSFRYSDTNTVDSQGQLDSSTAVTATPESFTARGSITNNLGGLIAGRTYYFQAIGKNSTGALYSYGDVFSFITAYAPTVTTEDVLAFGVDTATVRGTLDANGALTTGSFCISTSNAATAIDGVLDSCLLVLPTTPTTTSGTTNITGDAAGLSQATTYYYQAIGDNSQGTSYGSIKSFTTLAGAPVATTVAATNVLTTAATLNGRVNPGGASTIVKFCYLKTSSSVDGDGKIIGCTLSPTVTTINASAGLTSVLLNVDSLTANSTYYFQVVASNTVAGSTNTIYGSVLSFKTGAPIVQTIAATAVTDFDAVLNGTVKANGSNITAVTFCYGTDPTTSSGQLLYCSSTNASPNTFLSTVTIANPESKTVTSLTPGLTYFFQIVAVNAQGTSYGEVLTFTAGAPLGTTAEASQVTSSTARLNGSVNRNDDSGTTANFCLADAEDVNADESLATCIQTGDVDFTGLSPSTSADISVFIDVSNLISGNTYFFQIEAIGAKGTSVGEVKNFSTGYSVTFLANGGSGTMANQSAISTTALSSNTFTKSGSTFGGWSLTSGGSVAYADSASYDFSANLTLYAIWNTIRAPEPEPDPTPTPTPVEPKIEPTPTPVEPKKETPAPVTPVVPTAPATQPDAKFEVAPATAITVQSGGKNEVVTIRPNEEKTGIIVSGSDWTLGIRSTTQQVQGSTSDSSARVVIEKGNTVTTHGTGFKPYTQVDVWVYSTAIWLGATMTDANGEFETTVPMPAALSEGNHTFQAKGVTPDNKDRSAAIPITLVPAVATVKKGSLRFEVFFGLNSVAITSAEKKHIAAEVAKVKKSISGTSKVTVTVEGWVQPSGPASNVKYLSTFRAKHVAQELKNLKLKGFYKLVYQGLERDNIPSARHASVIVTWIK